MTGLLSALLMVFLQAADPPPTMIAIRMHEFGPANVLKLEQAPRPTPGDAEILVRVHAAAVNPVDWKIRNGSARGMVGANLPYIPGFDVSGVVEQVGSNVTRFKTGDEVFAMIDLRRGGGYAEYAIVKEDEAATKPPKTSHAEAAAMPLVSLTAWQALFDTAKLDKDQTVLIHGAAGGVGSVAVQLAKWKGARVIATASKENHDFLRDIGADETIDYRTQKFEELAKDVDVVLDTVGGETQDRSFAVLKKGGVLVSIVGRPSQQKADASGVRVAGILVHTSSDQLEQIAQLIEAGHLRPVVSLMLPLADAAKAHEQSETRHTRGKIILQLQK